MGANIVSVSIIRREKLQFMYNLNRFVASSLFFAQLKLWKQFTGRNAKSLMQSHSVNCFQNQFPLPHFCSRYIHNVSFVFMLIS